MLVSRKCGRGKMTRPINVVVGVEYVCPVCQPALSLRAHNSTSTFRIAWFGIHPERGCRAVHSQIITFKLSRIRRCFQRVSWLTLTTRFLVGAHNSSISSEELD